MDSDWDVIALINDFRSVWPIGPVRMNAKLRAPDGNEVEVFELNPADLHHTEACNNQLIREAVAQNIDV
jgi:hypothetical protein